MTSPQLGKNNFKAPFCHVTYFIKVVPKVNAVTMNMLRGPAENELDADQLGGSRLIFSSLRSEVNFLLLKFKTEELTDERYYCLVTFGFSVFM